jgi:hypothetical protein
MIARPAAKRAPSLISSSCSEKNTCMRRSQGLYNRYKNMFIYICAQMYSYESYKARANSGFVRLACVKYCRESMGLIVGVDGALEKASLHLPCITESYAPSSPSHLTVCHQVALSLSSLSVFVEREREHAHEQLTHHFLLCCSITGLGDGSFS